MDGPPNEPIGTIEDGAIAEKDGLIAWLGRRADLPGPAAQTVDCHDARILPGLIDCHTHFVFGGDRAAEFELRLKVLSYEEISRAGGSILSTVQATRETDEDLLIRAASLRLTVATDLNQRPFPAMSQLPMLNLARTLFRLAIAEALHSVTRHAAAAPGLRCGLALYRIRRPAERCHWIGSNPCRGRLVGGR